MAIGFAIIRTKRIKNINGAFNHNLRINPEYSQHVNHTKSNSNLILYDKFNFGKSGTNFEARIDKYIKENNIFVKKGTNIKCLEFMLTASPEFFQMASEDKKNSWIKTQMEFLKEEFGESLLHVVVHKDERTPHLQAIILADKKKIHKYKNQKGEFFKEKYTLSPGDYNPDYLRKLQDRYAEINNKFGLVRGLRNSKATHRTLKNFYAEIAKVVSKDYSNIVRKRINKVLKEDENIFGYIKTEKVVELLTPILNGVLKQLKAVKNQLNFNTPAIVNELNEMLQEKEKINELRETFKEAINQKISDGNLIEKLQKENEELKNKNSSLLEKIGGGELEKSSTLKLKISKKRI